MVVFSGVCLGVFFSLVFVVFQVCFWAFFALIFSFYSAFFFGAFFGRFWGLFRLRSIQVFSLKFRFIIPPLGGLFFYSCGAEKGAFFDLLFKDFGRFTTQKGTASGSIKIKPIPKKQHKKEPTNKRQPYIKFYAKVGI